MVLADAGNAQRVSCNLFPTHELAVLQSRRTGRVPSTMEVQRLQDTLHQARRHYAHRPEEAAAFLATFAEARRVEVGRDISAEEESAWALVASVLLNLDEVLCRG